MARKKAADTVEKPKAAAKKPDAVLLERARKCFKRAQDAFGEARNAQRDDIKFASGSPDNNFQWPNREFNDRQQTNRPALTINKLPLHIGQVTNDARQNRPSIKVRPVDDKADVETAEVLNGIARHIEAASDADTAYDMAIDCSATHGEGYLKVETEFTGDAFDQDIYIRGTDDPFAFWPDPDAIKPEASDATWWIEEAWYTDEEFEAKWPKAEKIDWDFSASNKDWAGWFHQGKVRVCRYWYKEPTTKTIALLPDGQIVDLADVPEGVEPKRTREVVSHKIVWATLNPNEVLERGEWAGSIFPFARVAGVIKKVDGKVIISGIVRGAKDAQRMYNYWVSQEAEFLGKWTKMPWLAPFESVEGFENDYQAANVSDKPVLFWNARDENLQPLPAPQRVQPPVASSGILQAKAGAADDIKSATGQFDASLGQRSNETSGRAILARQREGDTATFHYIDNLNKAVRQIGKIIIDLAPKVMDTARVARVLGEDGEATTAVIDPDHPAVQGKASAEVKGADGKIARIYNLGVGKYDVVSTVGPSFTTKRQEALEGMTELVQGNPQLWQVIGDLLVKNMDWPGAEDMAKRLRATLLPQVQQMEDEQEPLPPQVQAQMKQMKEVIDQLTAALEDAMEGADRLKAEAAARDADNEAGKLDIQAFESEIKAFDAGTKRITALAAGMTPEQVQAIVLQLLQQLANGPDLTPGDDNVALPEVAEVEQIDAAPAPEFAPSEDSTAVSPDFPPPEPAVSLEGQPMGIGAAPADFGGVPGADQPANDDEGLPQ